MPKCQLCDIEEETLYKCSQCGKMFCEYCGSTEDKICIDCLEEDIDEEEDWDDEEEDDSEE